jgi:magnesium transporter
MARFRVIELGPDGRLEAFEGAERTGPPPPDVSRWVDLAGVGRRIARALAPALQLSPARHRRLRALRSTAQAGGVPRSPVPRDQVPSRQGTAEDLELHELHAFLGERFLVTVHADEVPALEGVWQRVASDKRPLERGVDFVYYLIADRVVDSNFAILDLIADELEELEDKVLENPQRRNLARIFELKRHLVAMRKVLSPQRDTMAMLSRRGDARVSERTSLYFRDVYDHLSRINESIEANRDLLGNALDAYLSAVSNRTNEIMKYLTLLSAIFLPLAFVVGFFGQNFDDLPWIPNWVHSDTLMHAMIFVCLATPVAMLLWFRHKRWF